jgi:hypothetical protein
MPQFGSCSTAATCTPSAASRHCQEPHGFDADAQIAAPLFMEHLHRLSKKLHSPLSSIRRIIQPSGYSCADPRPSRRLGCRQTPTLGGRMIEFLAHMPTDTMLFLTMAVLGLAATLIVLRRLI